jgi:hypothetical protein
LLRIEENLGIEGHYFGLDFFNNFNWGLIVLYV